MPPLTPLETARLRLRPFHPSEGAFLEDCLRDQDARTLFEAGGRRVSPARLAARLLRESSRKGERAGGPESLTLAIALRETDRLIGGVLLACDVNRNAEVGLWLVPDQRKKGYGREAVRAILAFGFARLNLLRITGACRSDNVPSVRFMESAGLTFLHQLHAEGPRKSRETILVYSIRAP